MIAVLSYPKGIGKHIVCIYSGTVKSAIQTKIGDIPEPHFQKKHTGKTAEREDFSQDQQQDKNGCNAFS